MSRLFLLSIITLVTPLHGMQTGSTSQNYQQQCQIIQADFEAEKTNFCAMIDNNDFDPTRERINIDQQFVTYKKKLEAENYAYLLPLKQIYNTSDDDWLWCMHITEKMQNDFIAGINNKESNAIHDQVLCSEQRKILEKYLDIYGFDIKKITIERDYEGSPCIKDHIKNDLEVLITPTAQSIDVFPYTAQMKFCISDRISQLAAGDLVSAAWRLRNVECINLGLKCSIAKKSRNSFKAALYTVVCSSEFKQLVAVQRQQSELLPSLECYEACQWITQERSCNHADFTEFKCEHFRQLCTIKNLWEKRTILEELTQK